MEVSGILAGLFSAIVAGLSAAVNQLSLSPPRFSHEAPRDYPADPHEYRQPIWPDRVFTHAGFSSVAAAERIHAFWAWVWAKLTHVWLSTPYPWRHAMERNTPIVAIDLGKFKSVLCWFHPATGEIVFRSVRTSPESFRRELPGEPIECAAAPAS